MTAFENYVYGLYEGKIKAIKESHGINMEVSQAYSKLNEVLKPEMYREIMETIECDSENYGFDGYVQGFKDGMRFLISTVTV